MPVTFSVLSPIRVLVLFWLVAMVDQVRIKFKMTLAWAVIAFKLPERSVSAVVRARSHPARFLCVGFFQATKRPVISFDTPA
jgi:hypothetical protein